MSLLIAMLLAQAGTSIIVDPSVQSKRAKVTTTAGGALQVECVGGTCSGSSSGGGGDGGYTVVIQGPGADGGAAWGVTGTVTAVGPLTDTQLRASAVPVSNTNLDVALSTRTKPADQQHTIIDSSASIAVTGPITDTQLRATPVPVSGTVTTSPPSNATTNVTQFGGTNVSTGTGTSGAGIPRVTVSSDSSLAANQSVNVSQINAVTPLMGVGASGTGAQRVAALIHDGTTTAGVIVATTALKVDTSSIAGTATSTGVGASGAGVQRTAALIHDGTTAVGVIAATTALKGDISSVAGTAAGTAAAGVLKVGIVGNANAAIDAANNAAAPANVIVDGFEAQSSALGTSATASNVRRGIVGLDGTLYVREGGPLLFTGGVTAIGATLTQVVAAPAASTSLYLTDIMVMSDTATAGTFIIRYGTVSNCGTGTASLYPSAVTAAKSMYPGNATAPLMLNFHTPLKIPAANALCILCVATNTCTAQFWGYTAP